MTPRGIRLNNPGNIDRNATAWQGMSTLQDDPRFIRFDDPKYGLRALMKILLTYFHKYNLNTVESIISKYAPPVENATDSYINAVASRINVQPKDPIHVEKYLVPLAQAIVVHENGKCPDPTLPYWYPETTYREASTMALGA